MAVRGMGRGGMGEFEQWRCGLLLI
jgi:hypothetical protein